MVSQRTRILRSDLRAIYVDGGAYSLMVGLGETYVPAFTLALGMSEVAAGLIATLPMLIGSLLQLASLHAIRRIGSNRRWVVLCVSLQSLSFLPLCVGAWTGAMPAWLVFASVSLYWALGLGSGPAWSTWVETLIPRRLRIGYFAVRTRMLHAAVLAGIVAGGWILQQGSGWLPATRAFVLLFACAALARAYSAVCLAGQSEARAVALELRIVSLREFVARLAHGRDGRLLAYMLALQFAAQVAQPYFTPFMLVHLKLDYAHYMGLVCAAYLSKSLSLVFHRRFAERHGVRALMWLGGIALVPVSLPWIFTASYPLLFLTLLCSGTAWAAWELATFLSFFEAIEPAERTSVLTTYNACNALAFLLGSLAGAALLSGLGGGERAYFALFALSAGLRLCALPLCARIPRDGHGKNLPRVQVSVRAASKP